MRSLVRVSSSASAPSAYRFLQDSRPRRRSALRAPHQPIFQTGHAPQFIPAFHTEAHTESSVCSPTCSKHRSACNYRRKKRTIKSGHAGAIDGMTRRPEQNPKGAFKSYVIRVAPGHDVDGKGSLLRHNGGRLPRVPRCECQPSLRHLKPVVSIKGDSKVKKSACQNREGQRQADGDRSPQREQGELGPRYPHGGALKSQNSGPVQNKPPTRSAAPDL